MFMLRSFIPILFAALSASAATAEEGLCSRSLTGDQIAQLHSIAGTVKVDIDQNGYLPAGTDITLKLHTMTNNIQYNVFAVSAAAMAKAGNDPLTDAQQTVRSVAIADNKTTLVFTLDKDAKGWAPLQPMSILVVGCKLDRLGNRSIDDATHMPAVFGAVTTKATGALGGYIGAGIAGVVLLALVSYFAQKNSAFVGGFWRGLLYCITDFRQRVSLNLFQLLLFTSIIAMTVAWFFGRTWQISDLSSDVLVLLGISGASAVAAGLVDNSRERLIWSNWRWLDRLGAFEKDGTKLDLSLSQLVLKRGEFDLYKFQALLFTLVVAPTFVIASAWALGSAKIPQGMLAVLGLSQVSYIIGKLTDTPTLKDFDTSLTARRAELANGERLTPRGLSELKAEFAAAMGIDWAEHDPQNDPANTILSPGADTAQTATWRVDAQNGLTAARAAWNGAADAAKSVAAKAQFDKVVDAYGLFLTAVGAAEEATLASEANTKLAAAEAALAALHSARDATVAAAA